MGGYGNGAWLPSFFQRTHGLSAGAAGTGMGLMSVTFGTFGIVFSGYLSDWLIKRGFKRARMILLASSGIMSAPFMLLAVTVPNHYVAFAMLGPGYIATAITSAVWAAVITEMMPNQMRGLAVALAILLANLVGMGLGASIVAMVTEYIFNGEHDPLALGHSLAIVTPTIYVLSSVFGFFAIRKYQSALDYLNKWRKENSGDA
jgi:MFS family permease